VQPGAGYASSLATADRVNLLERYDYPELGSGLGLDRTALMNVLAASSGRSFAGETYRNAGGPAGFGHGARLLAKDLRILEALASEAGCDAEALSAAGRRFLALVGAA
jgi:3-hydroxyisobutyrate dehydrogenase